MGHIRKIINDAKELENTGSVGPTEFIRKIESSIIVRFTKVSISLGGEKVTVFYINPTEVAKLLKPRAYYKLDEGATFWSRLDFISLMLALSLGTSALHHVLIRYHTVPSQRDACKSTILAIFAIGTFYILIFYLVLGSKINGGLAPESSNMPLHCWLKHSV